MLKRMALLLASGMLLLTACAGSGNGRASSQTENSGSTVYHKITAEQAKQMMEQTSDYILLDVRTQDEYTAQRIKGALLIPDDQIKDQAETKLLDKNALILVYCRSGRRSAGAANELVQMGYTQIFDFSGIVDWPYDTVSGE